MTAMERLIQITDEFQKEFDVGEVDAQEYIGLWLHGLDEEYWCTIGLNAVEMRRFLEIRIPDKSDFRLELDLETEAAEGGG